MPVDPSMVDHLSIGTRDLYADAETRLLGMIARQLAAGMEGPGWAQQKLVDVQQLRRASQAVVDGLARTADVEIRAAVADAYNTGGRAALAELGALPDVDARRIAESTPNARSVDRLAVETVELVTATHRGILRGVEDGYRQVVAEVSAAPLLGVDTRRQASQAAMQRFADRGLTSFVDRAGRSWSMTSYAEMTVRTSTGRAAVEAHGDRLRDAGLDLVIVSNAPHECPLCKPYEGQVLTLDGPDGARTIEAEHAIEDGRTVRVHVLGSIDGARSHGFQHPNCRHSVSAYLPGVTTAPVEHSTDPDGYKASQEQRHNERQIRRWKNRGAAAMTPEGRRAAEAKVREWQKRQREHLARHPELRRKREREQPGGGNAPDTRAAPPQNAVEAARVRHGDEHTLREMSDQQLVDASGANILDARDTARVVGEFERRDLHDRVLPDGRLVEDLGAVGDDELGRILPELSPEQARRVGAELDRRPPGRPLPNVSPELLELTDEQLGHALTRATADDLPGLAAEAHRRELLARLYPDGALAGDLSGASDDAIMWAFQYGSPDDGLRLMAELDRRYDDVLPDATAGGDVAAWEANRAALDEAVPRLDDVPPRHDEEWGAWADDLPDDPTAGMSATERWVYERELADRGARTAYTREQIREMYQEYTYTQWLDAEDFTRGNLLSREAELAGVDPQSLFSGPAHVAYSRASEDLIRYWADNPRMTMAEFEEHTTGQRTGAAERARQARDNQNRKQ
ncbi:phage minor capsid protein [Embleya sp. MST-111070]|uniref:phage minor capsid protein n=1 Tax=Embleya sp. MST-111070 TaxID=3398231 RepID=UPI003F73A9C7